MDPNFQNNPQHLSPSARPVIDRQSTHSRHSSNEWHGHQRQPSSSLSPRFSNATPVKNVSSSFTPTDRALPSRDVTPETITNAYVAYILYCNPNFGLDSDSTTLRTNFQTPPKSDNKDFEIYRLFELIQKFDAKEIKTWGQLALDLGVEAPDVSKGQSVQKVQQYSVRLKRWMRAMHVDAFFEYLLGKQHAYHSEIPHPNDPYTANGRVGVLAEEDLAIRALDPSFRPKRGRRRNSEAEQEEGDEIRSVTNQTRFMDDVSQGVPASAHPGTLMPFNTEHDAPHDPWAAASAVTPRDFAPWMNKTSVPQSAMAMTAPSHLRWQLHGHLQNLATPHPMTALPTSMHAHIEAAFENEPKSAITPSSRKRRKHGPAVSSAWPSTNGPGAKPRGRPPASRNVQDGPFSTFPADPAHDKSSASTFLSPLGQMDNKSSNEIEQSMPDIPGPLMQGQGEGGGRPGRLSLQVPQHSGGPVRLATPPQVMVTSETSGSEQAGEEESQVPNAQPNHQRVMLPAHRVVPGFAFEALKRVVASDLLRADLIGRGHRLNGDEAKRLSDAVLDRLGVPRADTDNFRDDIARLTAASWLGVGEQLNVPLGPATGQNKRITVTRFRVDAEGYEEIMSAYDEAPGQAREVYDLSWTVTMGGCNGNFELKGLSVSDPTPEGDDDHDLILETWMDAAKQVGLGEDWVRTRRQSFEVPNYESGSRSMGDSMSQDGVDWKSKYRALEFGTRMAKGEFHRFRQRLIEKVLDLVI